MHCMKLSIGERIRSKDGFLGTVKYVGTLPDTWGNEPVIGVEWDKAERGKNCGEIKGKYYFRTDVPKAGSFIKLKSGKIETERHTFVEALLQKYGEPSVLDSKITFGRKTAEEFGFDKLDQDQAQFETILSVSLDSSNFAFPLAEGEKAVIARLKKIKHLDISFSLVNLFQLIWEIIEKLPTLDLFHIGGNRYFDIMDATFASSIPHNNLRILSLSCSKVPFKSMPPVLRNFPNIEELYIAGNNYNDKDLFELNRSKLRLLDLSDNELTKFPISCSNILSVNLKGNRIDTFEIQEAVHSKVIDLRENRISEWQFLDKLSSFTPNLSDLRINRNPLFQSTSIDEMTFNTLARFNCGPGGLQKLNGSLIREAEILEAELFFISQVRSGKTQIDSNSNHWKRLCRKHKIHENDTVQVSNHSELAEKKIKLLIINGDMASTIVLLLDNTVLRLKGMVARMCKVSVLEFELYFYIEGLDDKEQHYLDDDIALLDRYSFRQNQEIYVSFR